MVTQGNTSREINCQINEQFKRTEAGYMLPRSQSIKLAQGNTSVKLNCQSQRQAICSLELKHKNDCTRQHMLENEQPILSITRTICSHQINVTKYSKLFTLVFGKNGKRHPFMHVRKQGAAQSRLKMGYAPFFVRQAASRYYLVGAAAQAIYVAVLIFFLVFELITQPDLCLFL